MNWMELMALQMREGDRERERERLRPRQLR